MDKYLIKKRKLEDNQESDLSTSNIAQPSTSTDTAASTSIHTSSFGRSKTKPKECSVSTIKIIYL